MGTQDSAEDSVSKKCEQVVHLYAARLYAEDRTMARTRQASALESLGK